MRRIVQELMKVAPFLVFTVSAALWFGDASQLRLTVYYLATITLAVLVFHVGRKFMYPTLSIERHCNSARSDKNVASALVVVVFFGFQALMVWLAVSCITAMIR